MQIANEVHELEDESFADLMVDVNLAGGLPVELDFASLQERLGPSVGVFAELVHLPEGGGGSMTSGGTESIFLAVQTAREFCQ